jgi:hypothetical protein
MTMRARDTTTLDPVATGHARRAHLRADPAPTPLLLGRPAGVVCVIRAAAGTCVHRPIHNGVEVLGMEGTRDDVIRVVKPGENNPSKSSVDRGFTDKNVMPYELVDFVNEKTDYRALYRYGGDVRLMRTLLAAGFPLVVEKGYYEADYKGKVGWLGHYQFVTGYDDSTGALIVQDTYHDGPNFHIPYDKFVEGWRSFDFVFYIVYPPDHEQQLMRLLGPPDATSAAQKALDQANHIKA